MINYDFHFVYAPVWSGVGIFLLYAWAGLDYMCRDMGYDRDNEKIKSSWFFAKAIGISHK